MGFGEVWSTHQSPEVNIFAISYCIRGKEKHHEVLQSLTDFEVGSEVNSKIVNHVDVPATRLPDCFEQ
jgi:hypothetical protein